MVITALTGGGYYFFSKIGTTRTPSSRSSLRWGTPVVPNEAPGTATNLKADVRCNTIKPPIGIAELSWKPAIPPGEKQKIIITTYTVGGRNSETSLPLSAEQSSLAWSERGNETIHDWKVLTLHHDIWIPSETGRFTLPVCAEKTP